MYCNNFENSSLTKQLLSKNEARHQRFTGLNFEQTNLLAQKIIPLWNKAESKRLQRKDRKRKIGGGHPYTLKTIEEKIIVTLIYYKQYVTQELLGCMIGIDQSAVSTLLKKMLPIIEQAADPELKNYLAQAKIDCHKNRITTFEQLFDRHPDLRDVSTDATEQSIYRAKKYEEQKKYFSGKTKQHTIKTQASVASNGRILDISKSYPGSFHDKRIMNEEETIKKFNEKVPQRFDSGYQGVKNEYKKHYLILPIKKLKGRKLTPLEKELNRANSRRRVVVEHAFSRFKKFKILGNLFRQPLDQHNQIFRNIGALLEGVWLKI